MLRESDSRELFASGTRICDGMRSLFDTTYGLWMGRVAAGGTVHEKMKDDGGDKIACIK